MHLPLRAPPEVNAEELRQIKWSGLLLSLAWHQCQRLPSREKKPHLVMLHMGLRQTSGKKEISLRE